MAYGDTLSIDLITRLIVDSNITLRQVIHRLIAQVDVETYRATDYVAQTLNENIPCQESLDVIKSIPKFSREIKAYVSWGEAAHNAMSPYVRGSRLYFAVLIILSNKITFDANDILTNYCTVLNFEAIIASLDFPYSDKR